MRITLYFIVVLIYGTAIQAQNYKFGKVSEKEVAETIHPTNKEADAAILYKKQFSYYQYNSSTGFSLVTRYHYRIKLYTKEGFDWATVSLSGYVNPNDEEDIIAVRGRTYNLENGKLVEVKLHHNDIFIEKTSKYKKSVKFTLPALQIGSVIEYQYEKHSPFLSLFDDTDFQTTIPTKKLEVRVEVPEFFGVVPHYNQLASTPIIMRKQRESFSLNGQQSNYMQTIYLLDKENIPALKEEGHVDYLSNYAARVKWELQHTRFPDSPMEYFSRNWDDVVKSIYDEGGYTSALKENFFKEEIDELLLKTKTPGEKLVLAYNFVKHKVAWDGYLGYMAENGIRKAFKEGQGNSADINLLLTAILKHAGLEAHPILISTKSNGVPVFPTRSGFNYMAVGVTLNNQFLLLDATDRNAAPGELPERARNWQGRLIKDDGTSEWVSLLPATRSNEQHFVNIQLTKDFTLKGKITGLYGGLVAKKYRDRYKGISEESYLQELQKGKGDIVISGLNKKNEDNIGKDVKEVYEFELKNGIEVIGDKIFFNPMVFLAEDENPFKADERIFPIHMDFPVRYSYTINFLVPEGYRIASMPENVVVKMNEEAATFTFILSQSGGFIRLNSSIDMNQTLFPAKDYIHLKNFFDEIVSKHSEAIVLSKIENNNESTELTEGR